MLDHNKCVLRGGVMKKACHLLNFKNFTFEFKYLIATEDAKA